MLSYKEWQGVCVQLPYYCVRGGRGLGSSLTWARLITALFALTAKETGLFCCNLMFHIGTAAYFLTRASIRICKITDQRNFFA